MTATLPMRRDVVVSIDDHLVDRRIQRVLDALEDQPAYRHAVARSRLSLTDFLRSWYESGPVPTKERLTEWAIDWIDRRNDQPTKEN